MPTHATVPTAATDAHVAVASHGDNEPQEVTDHRDRRTALATSFATIGPLDVAAVFAALTASQTPQQRRSLAMRGSLISAAILVAFALVGEPILKTLGITLPALRTAGGILLVLMGIELAFARSSGANSMSFLTTLFAWMPRRAAR